MLEALIYACLAAPWAAMAYIVVADEISYWRSVRRDNGRREPRAKVSVHPSE